MTVNRQSREQVLSQVSSSAWALANRLVRQFRDIYPPGPGAYLQTLAVWPVPLNSSIVVCAELCGGAQ